jgi:small subunit ribosomal protein S10
MPVKKTKKKSVKKVIKEKKGEGKESNIKKDSQQEKSVIRIKIKAYDHKIIDHSARQIVEAAERSGAEIQGPVPLPTEIKKFTVNRSTFVHKDAREQYEMRIHKRIIDILNPTQKIIYALENLNLPAGVGIEIKM